MGKGGTSETDPDASSRVSDPQRVRQTVGHVNAGAVSKRNQNREPERRREVRPVLHEGEFARDKARGDLLGLQSDRF